MNRMILAIGGVAAVVIAVLAGSWYLGGKPSIGNGPTPSPTPSPTILQAGTIEAGRFFTDIDGYRYTFSVPGTGWEALDSLDMVGKGDHGNNPPDFGALFLWYGITGIYTEPCQWTGTFVTPGDSAAEWATALAGLSGFDTTAPTDVTIGGHPGKRLQLTVPADANLAGCEQDQYRSYEGRYYQLNGQVDDIWMVDVDGKTLMIRTTYDPDTSEANRTELTQMVESMDLAPLTP